jgi:hypothetical protein
MLHLRQVGGFVSTGSNRWGSIFGAGNQNFGPPLDGQQNSYTGRAFALGDAALFVDVAPGVGKSWTYFLVTDGVGQTGGATVISGAGTSALGNVGATVPPSATVTSADAYAAELSPAGTPAAVNNFAVCQEYDDSLTSNMTYMAAGDGASNIVMTGTDKFLGLYRSGTSAATGTEGPAQVVIGSPGTLTHFYGRVVVGSGAGDQCQLALRKGGADTTFVTTLVGAAGGAAFAVSGTPNIAVARGDLLCWRYKQTAGVNTNISLWLLLGFQPG